MSLGQASGIVRFGAWTLVAACGLAMSPCAMGQVAPAPYTGPVIPNEDDGPGLPFYDARLDADGKPLAAVTSHIDAARKATGAARDADLAKLRGAVPGVTVDDDGILGTARFVRSTSGFLTGAKQLGDKWSGPAVIKSFLAAYPGLMELDPQEIDAARVSRDYLTDHNGARHMTFQQQLKGVDLFECEVRANFSRSGELVNTQSTMLPRPATDFAVPAIKFDDAAALEIAAANVGVTFASAPTSDSAAVGPTMKRTWKSPDLRPSDATQTELIYFPLDRDTIHPAWSVSVSVKGVGHTYDILVDATDGAILRRADRLVWDSTQPVTLRVYTSDGVGPGSPGTPTPTTFQFPVVPRTLLTVNPADVIPYSPNGWINDGNMETVGNNVDAHLDLNDDDIADTPRPNGGPSRVFDFPLDPTQDPSTYRDAAVTQLFYRANWYHDKLMTLGFNEVAGNFQTTNFSGLGIGGDAVQADCQDSAGLTATGSNRNNANFSTTGADGTSARVQMYLFTGPTPDRDGSLDGDIVYHELTHGTSTRLHNGLAGTQPGGMGEGWSDFYGISLLAESTDDPDAVYTTGAYTTYQLFSSTYFQNYYYGIRRYPYCTDLTKNPLTFKFVDTGQLAYPPSVPRNTGITSAANEVHAVGEVWCMTLLECRAQMWHTYGFAGDLRMLQMVTDAMKLSARNPNFIQARDAVLQADLLDYGGVDTAQLWTAFAKRGLGFSATSPVSTTTSGVHEAFDSPPTVAFGYPSSVPKVLEPGLPTTFPVNVAAIAGITPTDGTAQMFVSVNGGAFAPIALTDVGVNQYTAALPAANCLDHVKFYFSSATSAGTKTDPATAPAATYFANVYSGTHNVVTDGFEVASGWTTGTGAGDTATTGMWERATPQQTAAQPGAAHTGTFCWVTGASAGAIGANDVDGGRTTLFSPNYDLSMLPDARVSYWRWYSNALGGLPGTNTFRVDVSINGGTTWTNAETVGPFGLGTAPGWFLGSWTLSSLGLTPTATVKVRFIAEDITGSVVEAAVDDFAIDSLICAPANFAISVTTSGSGHGTVTSSPAGIACPGTCAANFASGTPLTLAAAPDAGSVFVGWSGGCTGTDPCTSTVSGPASYEAIFRCAADFNGADGITVQDIFDFLSAWFAGAPGADFNGANGITVQDIFDFLSAWFAGCP